jgi:hypothetical protein
MRNKLSLFFSIGLLLAIVSCEKAENKIYYQGGTPPSLASSSSNVLLEPGLESQPAIAFHWTNPDFRFTNGISSQDVTYTLELDTLGADFGSTIKYSAVIAKDLAKSYTVGELNGILGNTMLLQLDPRRQYTLQARVIASIGSSVALPSNVLSFTTTPFAPPPKVAPPTSGHLYLVGDATPGDWNNPVPVPSQEFTKLSTTKYEITITLKGGSKHYLFLPVNGDWGNKYACHDKTKQSPDGGDFGYNGSDSYWNDDLTGPTSDGSYKITVDFQLGKYTVVKQ